LEDSDPAVLVIDLDQLPRRRGVGEKTVGVAALQIFEPGAVGRSGVPAAHVETVQEPSEVRIRDLVAIDQEWGERHAVGGAHVAGALVGADRIGAALDPNHRPGVALCSGRCAVAPGRRPLAAD
jgi:hypothetical protein